MKSSKTNVFDPLDRTVQETTQAGANPAKTKAFGFLGLSDQVISEETPGASPTVDATYTYGPGGERISQTKKPGVTGEETSYYGENPHTDVETLTSETGAIRSTYRYTGYGSNDATGFTGKDKASATGGPEVEVYNPYRFNSKRWDPATASYDMGFRDYSPGLNRFLTRDMYNGALADLSLGGDPWTMNRYAFAGGNPITGIEYDGHYPQDPEHSGTTSENIDYRPGGTQQSTSTSGKTSTPPPTLHQHMAEEVGLPRDATQQQVIVRTAQIGVTPDLVIANSLARDHENLFNAMETAGRIGADVIGINGAKECARTFNLSPCAWTAVTMLPPARIGKLGKGIHAAKGGTELRRVGDVLGSIDDVYANPQLLKGRHPALVENILKDTPGWRVETLGRGSAQGRGWVFRQYTDAGNPTGPQLRWHPGGGHHGPDPYWRVIGPNGDLGGIIR